MYSMSSVQEFTDACTAISNVQEYIETCTAISSVQEYTELCTIIYRNMYSNICVRENK